MIIINFQEWEEKLTNEGYTRKDLTISIARANWMAIFVMFPFVLVIACVFWKCTAIEGVYFFTAIDFLYFVVGYTCLIILHELIHGLVWGICCKNHFKSISFGVVWKMLTPYCTCSEPLTRWQYILGSVMPTLILGFGLGIASIVIDSVVLMLISEFMIIGGGGDFLVIFNILSNKPSSKDAIYLDHPSECGVVLFEK